LTIELLSKSIVKIGPNLFKVSKNVWKNLRSSKFICPKFETRVILTNETSEQRKSVQSTYFFFSVSLFFGSIAMAAGMLGVPLGAFLSTRLASKFNGR